MVLRSVMSNVVLQLYSTFSVLAMMGGGDQAKTCQDLCLRAERLGTKVPESQPPA